MIFAHCKDCCSNDHERGPSSQAVVGYERSACPWLAVARGGGRVIYYFVDEQDRIYLLFFYRKAERADLTPAQLRTLRRLVEDR